MFANGLSPLSALQQMASPIYGAAIWVLDQAQELATDLTTSFPDSDGSVSLLGMTFAEEYTLMDISIPSSPIPAAEAVAPFDLVQPTPPPQVEKPLAFELPAKPAAKKGRKSTKASKGKKNSKNTKKVTFSFPAGADGAATPTKRCRDENAAPNAAAQPSTPLSAGISRVRFVSAFRSRSPTPEACQQPLASISLNQAFAEAAILDPKLNAELAAAAQAKADAHVAAVRAEIIEKEVKPLAEKMAANRKLRMLVHEQRTKFAAECLVDGLEVLAAATAAAPAPASPDADSLMEEATRRVLGQYGQQEKRFTASLNQPLRRRVSAAAQRHHTPTRAGSGSKRARKALHVFKKAMAVDIAAQAAAAAAKASAAAAAAAAAAPAQQSSSFSQLLGDMMAQGFALGMGTEERVRLEELHGGVPYSEGFNTSPAPAAAAAAAPSFSPFSQAALYPRDLVKDLTRVRAPKRGCGDEGGLDHLAAEAPALKRARTAADGDEAILAALSAAFPIRAPVLTAVPTGAVQERAVGRKRGRDEPTAAAAATAANCENSAPKRRSLGGAVFTGAPAAAAAPAVLQPLSGNALLERSTADTAAAAAADVTPAKKGKKKTAPMKKPSAAATASANVWAGRLRTRK